MWIFTSDGFYSAVDCAHCSKKELLIQARVRADLERLKKHVKFCGEVTANAENEYLYSVVADRESFAEYLKNTVMKIDYTSSLRGVIPDKHRGILYMGVEDAIEKVQKKMVVVEGTWQDVLPVYDPEKHGV